MLSTTTKAGGEYRAVLRKGSRTGPIISDTGWKNNTVLDYGLYSILTWDSWAWSLWYGDSGVAATTSQLGLQGNLIPRTGGADYVSHENAAVTSSIGPGPEYPVSVTEEWISEVGEHTATIREFVLGHDSQSPITNAAVRVALDVPIVKGPDDVLTMQYRFTYYLDNTTKTGVIDISGVDYNYKFRRQQISYKPHSHQYQQWVLAGSYTYFKVRAILTDNGDIQPIESRVSDSPNTVVDTYLDLGDRTGLILNTGGTTPNFYRTLGATVDVDNFNGTFDMVQFEFGNGQGGCQVHLAKVSDGTPFTKLNTHTFQIQMRLYLERYVP